MNGLHDTPPGIFDKTFQFLVYNGYFCRIFGVHVGIFVQALPEILDAVSDVMPLQPAPWLRFSCFTIMLSYRGNQNNAANLHQAGSVVDVSRYWLLLACHAIASAAATAQSECHQTYQAEQG